MKYAKYLVVAAAAFCMQSCSDDFLDKEPSKNASLEQVQEAIDQDPEALNAFVSGFYKNLYDPEARDSHDDFGLKAFELATDLMGEDMAYKTSHFFIYDHLLDNRDATYRRSRTFWQSLYAAISGTNEVISKLIGKSEEWNETEKSMMGQSYVIRAYCYFWLINMYQQPYEWNKDKPGIPLYNEKEIRLNRVPVKEIYDQILGDLEKGFDLLKGTGMPADKSYMNEYAAAAIYANVLSFVNDYPDQWNKVAEYADYATKGGELMTEKELLSGFNNIALSEVLWGADINSETNTFYASFMSHIDAQGPGYGGALGNYKMIASALYDKIADNDIRKQWFGVEVSEKNAHYPLRQYIQKKFMDTGTTGTDDTFCSDYIYFRTGEMYFVGAEALYRAGKQAEAKAKLEEVMRTRVPGYTCNKTGNELLEEIMIQKRIEMWGEGRRLFDMKRRGENLDRTASTNMNATAPMQVPAGSKLFIYQIPQKELDANLEISEEDQNE